MDKDVRNMQCLSLAVDIARHAANTPTVEGVLGIARELQRFVSKDEPIMATIKAFDYTGLIDMNRDAYGKMVPSKGVQYGEGYLQAHEDIKAIILKAQADLVLEPGEVIEPCKGIELAPGQYSGCNQSHGDCPVCGE